DTQIARDVLLRLRTHPGLPQNAIRAIVADGEVTLEGVVHWQLQKLTAESIIRNLRGVRRIHNLMEVRAGASTANAAPAGKGGCHRHSIRFVTRRTSIYGFARPENVLFSGP